MSIINTSASNGLRKLCNVVTLGCIAASMTHVGMFLSEMFEPGLFLYVTLIGLSVALIGSQGLFALTTQAIRGQMPWWVILLGALGVLFMEGIVSIPTSQVAINHNMIKGSASQQMSSQEAVQIRKAIDRSDARIVSLDATLASSAAENVTNRATVMQSIEVEEQKIRKYRAELGSLGESSASQAFGQMMWGMSREGLADVMAASFSIVPSIMSIILGAMAFGRREETKVVPITSKVAKGKPVGKKLRAVVQALTA